MRSYAVMSMADVAVNGDFDFEEVIQLLTNNLSSEKSIHVKISYYYAFCALGKREYYDVILQHLFHKAYQIRLFSISLLLQLIKKEDYEKTLEYLITCEKNEKFKDVRNTLLRAIDTVKAKL